MYYYSSYWGTWSRVLSNNHPKGPFVEVNLTPIPCCHSSGWENDVAPIRIRFHGTAREEGDKVTDRLPESIYAQMVEKLGAELVNRLLEEDFLSQIDMGLYNKYNNGGANFEDIRKKQ